MLLSVVTACILASIGILAYLKGKQESSTAENDPAKEGRSTKTSSSFQENPTTKWSFAGLGRNLTISLASVIVGMFVISMIYSFVTRPKELPVAQGGSYAKALKKCVELEIDFYPSKGYETILLVRSDDPNLTMESADIRVNCYESKEDDIAEEFLYGSDHKLRHPLNGKVSSRALQYFHHFRIVMGKNSLFKEIPEGNLWVQLKDDPYYEEELARMRANGL